MNADDTKKTGMRDSLQDHVIRRLRYLRWSGEPLEGQERIAKLYARHLAFDWQKLLADDMIGMFDWTPKFMRRYTAVREIIARAAQLYADDVRNGSFPSFAETYFLYDRTQATEALVPVDPRRGEGTFPTFPKEDKSSLT